MQSVLIAAYTCCPNRGSEPGNGWNWILNYSRQGFKIYCVTSGLFRNEIEAFLKANSVDMHFFFVENALGKAMYKFPVLGEYLHYFNWLIKARHLVKKLNKENKFSFSHHVTYGTIKLGSPLYNLKSPIILGPYGSGEQPHRSLRKYFGKYWLTESFKHKLSELFCYLNPTVKKSITSASLILVNNKSTFDIAKTMGGKNIQYMFHSQIPEYFHQEVNINRTLSGAKINILWIGRMLPRKGLNLAIEAFSKLRNIEKYRFWIVGEGQLYKDAAKYIKQLNLDNVELLGEKKHGDIVAICRSSHVFLFPTLKDSCPVQVFETMALGLPVVTLNHQGMVQQVVSGSGIKVPVGTNIDYASQLATAVEKITANQTVYDEYSNNAFVFGQQQLGSRMVKSFISNNLKDILKN